MKVVHKAKLTSFILDEFEPPFSITAILYFVRPKLTRFSLINVYLKHATEKYKE